MFRYLSRYETSCGDFTASQSFSSFSFDEEFVYDAVERVNLAFGGLEPDVNNTINIHGVIDPWHYLGVHDRDLKESSPTITVPR